MDNYEFAKSSNHKTISKNYNILDDNKLVKKDSSDAKKNYMKDNLTDCGQKIMTVIRIEPNHFNCLQDNQFNHEQNCNFCIIAPLSTSGTKSFRVNPKQYERILKRRKERELLIAANSAQKTKEVVE